MSQTDPGSPPTVLSLFDGTSEQVLAAMGEHFAWLAQDAARQHSPADDWTGFVAQLWKSTARWVGWAEDQRSRQDVPLPWFQGTGDAKSVGWYAAEDLVDGDHANR